VSPFLLVMALSTEKRKIVVNLSKQGKSQKEIASTLNSSRRTVSRILKRKRNSGSVRKKEIIGRPRTLPPREERLLVTKVICNPPTDAVSLASEMSQELRKEITARTVWLTLHRNGFKGRKPVRKPLLKKNHRQRRLEFAREFAKKPLDFWKKVIFSDKAPFQVFATPSGQWTWRRPHEKLEDRNIFPTVKHGGGTLQIWGSMTWKGIGWMCKLPEGLDAETHKEILDDEVAQTAKNIMGDLETAFYSRMGPLSTRQKQCRIT